jgi:hypothetical protein
MPKARLRQRGASALAERESYRSKAAIVELLDLPSPLPINHQL